MPPIVLLGPQRLRPTLAPVVRSLGIRGPMAAITAGWQDREAEDGELRTDLALEVRNLELYRRAEEVFAKDKAMLAAHRKRQDALRALQTIYRKRLDHAMADVYELFARDDDPSILHPEREHALETVRALDQHHLARIAEIHEEFEETVRPGERRSIKKHRKELAKILDECEAVAVAGGHVAALLNRLLLFGIGEHLGTKPVFAWSAGAMALSERIVLFHDSPPQGKGNSEVLENGLAIYPEVLPLPHARRRLHLDDEVRVAIFARRHTGNFTHRDDADEDDTHDGPIHAVALDEGTHLVWDGEEWESEGPIKRLGEDGKVTSVLMVPDIGAMPEPKKPGGRGRR